MSEHSWFKKFMGIPLKEQTDKHRRYSILVWIIGAALLFILIKGLM